MHGRSHAEHEHRRAERAAEDGIQQVGDPRHQLFVRAALYDAVDKRKVENNDRLADIKFDLSAGIDRFF